MKQEIEKQAWKAAKKKIRKHRRERRFDVYQGRPVAFCEEVLGASFTEDVKSVMASVVDNPVTLARSANGPGKSHAAAHLAVYFYMVYPESQVYTTAAPPIENLQRVLWGEIMGIVNNRPALFNYDKVRVRNIIRHSKHFITGVAIPQSGTPEEREAKFSGKHAPQIFFVVDEGDAVPPEVYRGIESCMSGGLARLLVLFNPRAKSGPVYMMEESAQANVIHLSAFNHPNVTTGNDIYPGAVTREITVRRINEWTRPLNPNEKQDENTFEVPDFLVGEQATSLDGTVYPPLPPGFRVIENPSFAYMVLGEYPAQAEQQLISESWISDARARYDAYVAKYGKVPPVGVRPKLGVDVGEFGPDGSVACLRYGGWVAPLILWSGIDPDATAIKAAELYVEKDCEIAYVDATGVGSGVPYRMTRHNRKQVRAVPVKVSERPTQMTKTEEGEFKTVRDELWWRLRDWLRKDKGAMLPPDPFLLQELRAPKYYKGLDGRIRVTDKDTLREMLRRSPDRADALCLTMSPMERVKVVRLQG